MGQNPMLSDWKQNIYEPTIYTNIKTNDQVQCHVVTLKKQQEFIIKRRMNEQHGFITKVVYYRPQPNNYSSVNQQLFYVYTQRMMPIKNIKWLPVMTALTILKGFRRLSTSFGLIRVLPEMVGMNEKDEIKVWINSNPSVNQPTRRANNQEEMISDIAKIIVKYDPETATLLIGCLTLNEAISNILTNMTECNTQTNLSSRTARTEIRKVNKKQQMPTKNIFRETKQTEDDYPKTSNYTGTSQYLQNVNLHSSPRYIKLKQQGEDKKKAANGFINLQKEGENKYAPLNLSEKNHPQKYSSIQINSSQPQKKIEGTQIKKSYKPVQIIPKYQLNYKNISGNNDSYLKKHGSGSQTYFLERKSQLNKEIAYGKDQGRISNFSTAVKPNKIQITSKQKELNNLLNNHQNPKVRYHGQKDEKFDKNVLQKHKNFESKTQDIMNFSSPDYNRTKTQQFDKLKFSGDNSWKSSGPIPQYQKRKKIQLKSQIQNEEKNYNTNFNKKKFNLNNDHNIHNKHLDQINLFNSTRLQSGKLEQKQDNGKKLQKIKSHPSVTQDYKIVGAGNNQSIQTQNHFQERKEKKKELSKQIRDQFTNILSSSKNDVNTNNSLGREKSGKDLLIRQKIQSKKAKYADLKTETMKILFSD